jgi:hypothetical protein
LHGGAAGHKEDGVVIADTRKSPTDISGFGRSIHVGTPTMRVFHQSDTGFAEIEQFFADPIDHHERHVGWSGREVVDPVPRRHGRVGEFGR